MSSPSLILNDASLEIIENVYTNLVKNRVCKRVHEFYCYLCKKSMPNLVSVINHIIENKEHQKKCKIETIDNTMLRNFQVDEVKCAAIALNGIVLSSLPSSSCIICCCKMPNIEHIFHHISSSNHINCTLFDSEVEAYSSASSSSTKSPSSTISNCNSSETDSTNSQDQQPVTVSKFLPLFKSISNLSNNKTGITNISKADSLLSVSRNAKDVSPEAVVQNTEKPQDSSLSKTEQTVLSEVIVCKLCDLVLENETMIKYHNMFHVHEENCYCPFIDVIEFKLTNSKFIQCRLCDFIMDSEKLLEKHLKDQKHINLMNFMRKPKTFEVKITFHDIPDLPLQTFCYKKDGGIKKKYKCHLCNVTCNDDNILNYHITGNKHIKNSLKFSKKSNVLLMLSNFKLLKSKFMCFICNTEYDLIKDYYLHIKDKKHKNAISAINTVLRNKSIFDFSSSNDLQIMTCSLCDVRTNCPFSALKHLNNIKHRMKIKETSLPTINNTVKTEVILTPREVSTTDLQMIENPFSCPVCDIRLKDESAIINHFSQTTHKNKMFEQRFEEKLFSCIFCAKRFTSDTLLFYHIHDENHKKNKTRRSLTVEQLMNWKKKDANKDIEVIEDKQNAAEIRTSNLEYYSGEGLISNLAVYGSTTSLSTDIFSEKKSNHLPGACSTLSLNEMSYSNQMESLKYLKKECDENKEEEGEKEINVALNLNKLPRQPTRTNLVDPTYSKQLSSHGAAYIKMCIHPGKSNIYHEHSSKIELLRSSLTIICPTSESKCFCIACTVEVTNDSFHLLDHIFKSKHLLSLQAMDKCDSYFDSYGEQFSDFALGKSHMATSCELPDNFVKCYACEKLIEDCDATLRSHIESSAHASKSQRIKAAQEELSRELEVYFTKTWYYVQKFSCQLCDVLCRSELLFVEHLLEQSHERKVQEFQKAGISPEVHVCVLCVTCLLGKPDVYEVHCRHMYHKSHLETRAYLELELPDAARDALNSFKAEIEALLVMSGAADPDTEKEAMESVWKVVSEEFPSCQLYLCGARSSRLGLPESDFNFYVECDEDFYGKLDESEREGQKRLLQIQKSFEDNSVEWTIEEPVKRWAKSLRLRHWTTNLYCNIYCSNGLIVEKSKLIGYYNDACPVCRELIFFLRKWTSLCHVNMSQNLTTYTISLIVIFYLQTKDIVPSVKQVIEQQDVIKLVAGRKIVSKNTISMKNHLPYWKYLVEYLLLDMFQFYANFDYMTDVICPYLGHPIKKCTFVDEDEPFFSEFSETIYPNQPPFRIDSPMCVQDPLEHEDNVTKDISKFQLRAFINYCSESAAILSTDKHNLTDNNN